MINVTKTYLPDFDEYTKVLKRSWDKGWITNNGELVQELERKLAEYLGVPYLMFCTNGTVVLQMALRALGIKGEVITTPFSYVATTGSILWEHCKPVFADIEADNYNIDVSKIEELITDRTEAIMATHVYGLPCDVEAIEKLALKHNLKVIYDGAHAFGCVFNGKSLLSYGDVSTCSFHATKLFHTVEGGAVICHSKEVYDKLFLYRQFGHIYDDYIDMGINGKNSEFHAAMGIVLLPKIADIIKERKEISELYTERLAGVVQRPGAKVIGLQYNYAYYPIVFQSEDQLLQVRKNLELNGVNTRRYFYPSLNTLPYLKGDPCPVSEDISSRVLCLPLYPGLAVSDVNRICDTIISVIDEA